jgi:putative ABC transport system permease protein
MNITKNYKAGGTTVEALKGVSLEFRENEFVCVLGPSGCGKTTLLNIVGGLDQYTTGDLIINGKSTKDYRDGDWDAYRNHSIGFVFQSYNLIPHQTVLSNVELALTLTGVSKSERTARAKAVIESVGLADQTYKKPNQLSGGQMQRVAIARALVNNPDILLADEPTGSLDSETSVQIMEILKKISKNTLVIMVTHNPELANRYSTRIVRLLDGLVTSDSVPETAEADAAAKTAETGKRPSMSFFTALALSLNNLMTKKARTALTAFAGSIGIIGIALILALSSGLQDYISRVEEETLSSYPITIEQETFDISSFFQSSHDDRPSGGDQSDDWAASHPLDKIYVSNIMSRMLNTAMSSIKTNDLAPFREKLKSDAETLDPLVTAISYGYDVPLDLYIEDGFGSATKVNPNMVIEEFSAGGGSFSSPMMMGNNNHWSQLIDNQEFLMSQYDLIAGRWPGGANDVVLVVNENNRVTDLMLYSLGLRSTSDLRDFRQAIINSERITIDRDLSYSYDEMLALSYRLVLPIDRYAKTDEGWVDISDDFARMQSVYANSEKINIVGILRPNESAIAASSSGIIGYTSDLVKLIVEKTNQSEIVLGQLQNPGTDIFTGRLFSEIDTVAFSSIEEVYDYIQTMTGDAQEQAVGAVTSMREAGSTDEHIVDLFNQAAAQGEKATYEGNLKALGVADLDKPSSVSIYPSSFENKESIIKYIDEYNESVGEDYEITYTDYVGLLMSSVTTVINAISYVLIAFVSISLVVSSIMIGIITYISVLERTKEIGILRSIGASKRDVSRVFNAETLIIGFVAGALGIAVTLLLCVPANAIILRLTEISNVARLPASGAAILVAISMVLSVIAGLIPSRVAARKDPVVALRTE